jgi:hypothetical protein
MAGPSESDLGGMDYLSLGEPFVVPNNTATDLLSMDYISLGEPFVLTLAQPAPPSGTQRARITTYIWGN